MRPRDLPAPERWPHGVRARYTSGCRCPACRTANTMYMRARERRAREMAEALAPRTSSGRCPGVGKRRCGRKLYTNSVGGRCARCRSRLAADSLVSAARARAHVLELSALGIGRDAVAAAADVSVSVIQEIRAGTKAIIRRTTSERILAVDAGAVADHGLVDAGPTRALLQELLALGVSKTDLARRLGHKSRPIQYNRDRVLARTALRIRRLHAAVLKEHAERERELRERCQCQCPLTLERGGRPICARCERAIIADDVREAPWTR